MAQVTVARHVGQASAETVLVRDVAEDMILLEPDASPLFVMTNNAKRKKPAKSPVLEWIEDAEMALWDSVNNGTTSYASNATQVLVTDGTLFATNDLILIPKADSSAAAEEVCLVTAVSTNTLTLTRNIGGAGADTIGATNSIRILGGAFTENSSVPGVRSTSKVVKTSYTQIFRTAVSITNTMKSTEQFGPSNEQKYQLAKALVRHRSEIEAAGLWGRASTTAGTPTTRRTTMGFKSRVTTNVTDITTTLTLAKWLTFSETAFRYGDKTKLLIAAPKVISGLHNFSYNKLMIAQDEKVFGVKLTRIRSAFGDYLLANNFRMEEGVSGADGFADEAYVINLPAIEMRYLAGNGNSRDTKLYQNLVQDGTDGQTDNYLSEIGWIIRHEKQHARLYDCSDYS